MRAVFVYSAKDKGLSQITKYMVGLLENAGHTVKTIEVGDVTSPISLRPFDLIFVGARVVSTWGGKISEEVVNFVQGTNGMEGKKAVAYIKPGLFSTDKALRRLMSQMESRGAFVVDFEAVKGEKEAKKLIERHINK